MLRLALIVVGDVVALLLAVFAIWTLTPYRTDDTALEAMRNGGGVTRLTVLVRAPESAARLLKNTIRAADKLYRELRSRPTAALPIARRRRDGERGPHAAG
ncbi:MAG: hypothetical protein IBX63_05215 [Coriobacteriia bacterium]|nr:hypothetical protein [Coriobacteriia bacterium]